MMWNFERFGDRTALVDEHGASLTYRQLKREADALCAAAGLSAPEAMVALMELQFSGKIRETPGRQYRTL